LSPALTSGWKLVKIMKNTGAMKISPMIQVAVVSSADAPLFFLKVAPAVPFTAGALIAVAVIARSPP